jgi:cytochrome c-type biogenesis protein CcmH
MVAVLLLALAGLAFGQSAEVANPDPRVEERLKALALELRCLVCQNQTIADSNAPLAVDLRQQIRAQIAQGRSDDQIRDYMVERYGDFVLYKPPFKATTAVLWAAPFLLLALGAGVLFGVVRRRRSAPSGPAEVAPSRRVEIEALLAGEAPRAPAPSQPAKKPPQQPKAESKKRRPRR